MLTLTLPWPSADLSPNARVHFMPHARAKKAAKNYAWGMTKAAMGPLRIAAGSWTGPIDVYLTFHPAMNRARDVDNLIASHKAALDGIAMALGVDDSTFRIMACMGAIRKPAAVVVTLTPSEVAIPHRGTIE